MQVYSSYRSNELMYWLLGILLICNEMQKYMKYDRCMYTVYLCIPMHNVLLHAAFQTYRKNVVVSNMCMHAKDLKHLQSTRTSTSLLISHQ